MDINNYISDSFRPEEPKLSKEQINSLFVLLRETRKSHHETYLYPNGDDPEWPLWYAEFMHEKVMDILDLEITKSELIYLLVAAHLEHQDEAPDRNWATYYASFFSDSLS